MTRSQRMRSTALVLLALQGAAMAAVNAEVATALTRKSGLATQLGSLGAQVRGGMSSAMDKNPDAQTPQQKATMLACADSAYAADDLRATAMDAVAGALQESDVTSLLDWYDGPLGRKIASVEAASAMQATDPQERVRLGTRELSNASAGRVASLKAILVETHSVDLMTDTLIEMALAVQQGMASADPLTASDALVNYRASLTSRRPQLLAHYTQISLPAYAFTYRELGDDELKQYAEHLATPSAEAFSEGSARGVARALAAGSTRLGRCLKGAGS